MLAPSRWSRFTTATATETPWEFLYFGDAQKGLTDVWPNVAAAAYASAPDAKVTIAAGDNVIRLLPPLIATDSDITEAVNKLEMTCRSLEVKK